MIRGAPFGVAAVLLASLVFGAASGAANGDGDGLAEDWLLGTTREFDQAAAMLRLSAPEPATCTMSAELAGRTNLAWTSWISMEGPDGILAGFWRQGSLLPAHAHVGGLLRTQELIELQGYTFAKTWAYDVRVEDAVDLLVAGHDLTPWPEGLTGGPEGQQSIAFSVACDRPVAAHVYGDADVRLVTQHAPTGAGAWTYPTGGALVAHACAAYPTDMVRFRGLALGAMLGEVRLDHPGGSEAWGLVPEEEGWLLDFGLDGGQGAYELRLHKVDVPRGGFFTSFLAGFHPVADLDGIAALPGAGPSCLLPLPAP